MSRLVDAYLVLLDEIKNTQRQLEELTKILERKHKKRKKPKKKKA